MQRQRRWPLAAKLTLIYGVQGSYWPLLAVHLYRDRPGPEGALTKLSGSRRLSRSSSRGSVWPFRIRRLWPSAGRAETLFINLSIWRRTGYSRVAGNIFRDLPDRTHGVSDSAGLS